jgi:hypothetical protein
MLIFVAVVLIVSVTATEEKEVTYDADTYAPANRLALDRINAIRALARDPTRFDVMWSQKVWPHHVLAQFRKHITTDHGSFEWIQDAHKNDELYGPAETQEPYDIFRFTFDRDTYLPQVYVPAKPSTIIEIGKDFVFDNEEVKGGV